jgi:hypothetical protein
MITEAAANELVRELALRLLSEDIVDALDVLDRIALGTLELFGARKVIPEAAVEAAEARIRTMLLRVESGGDALGIAVAALEAAAPHLRKPRTITTVEELDELPVGSVIRDSLKRVFERWHLAGWQCAGPTLKHEIVLPVTVLDEP